jgi:hypothetical protein
MAAHVAPPGPASFETAGKSRPPQDEGPTTQIKRNAAVSDPQVKPSKAI